MQMTESECSPNGTFCL